MGEDRGRPRRPSGREAGGDESLPREQRITLAAEFRAVLSAGARGVSRYLVAVRSPGAPAVAPSRLGVVASRKVGGAVRRARAKRLLREVYRRQPDRPAGDLVLIARRGIHEASWPNLVRAYRIATGMTPGKTRPRRRLPLRDGPGRPSAPRSGSSG